MAVLALVELDEVGAGVDSLADEDRDREHRLGDGQDALRSPRALAGEDESREIGARLDGYRDVFLAREPADLDEGSGASSRSFAAGSGARMSVEPTRTASAPASSAMAA